MEAFDSEIADWILFDDPFFGGWEFDDLLTQLVETPVPVVAHPHDEDIAGRSRTHISL